MLALANPVQDYAWGAVDGLARLVGTPPTDGPEAELWVGAHPAAPSTTAGDRPLDQVVDEDPEGLLGPTVVARHGARLPYLLKVLAIGAPLSIQLHPSARQAEDGFAREEAAGLARDDPRRSYRDPRAKPEVLVALVPTWVMAGFRSGADAARALGPLTDHPAVARLRDRVADEPDARSALVHLLAAPDEERAALATAAAAADPADGPEMRWVAALAEAYPGDPTALGPALLALRRLEVGEGLFLPAGVPHMYLQGAGVELMGASDNVVRGGLTPKHVDRDELVRLLAPPGTGPVALPGEPGPDGATTTYAPGAPELALHRTALGPDPVALPALPGGPALVLVLGGTAALEVGEQVVELGRGRAALVAAGERSAARISGAGTAWWATVGPEPAG
ncbi:mannose-6-phosphate isomerase, class I [Iamia majanohamensis]|uniref:mannose-6-phosphate isomerase n=1 Tax=Iamia majanohamensis TaxID=467976 RepID=A0AAF0BXM5_9ACTN|nr:mannose-6-phosphate isomerase, class I [Iamia majanohamensis]WCO69113.1 mannose-6-phosphate isomerase, class I [Iamia majanohamensis]